MKRQRGRGRKPGGGGGGNHGNRPLESNGPEVKIRGTAAQIYEKYTQYARDAQSSGDRVKYENYLQHAEHYFRIMMATMPRDRLFQQQEGGGMAPMQAQGGEGGGQSLPVEGNVPVGAEGMSADPLKVMDDQGEDGEDYDGDDAGEDADRDEVEAGAQDEGQAGGGASGQNGERHGRRRRRGRRNRHPDDRGGGDGGGSGGGGGGSALDSLARKQGALAGG